MRSSWHGVRALSASLSGVFHQLSNQLLSLTASGHGPSPGTSAHSLGDAAQHSALFLALEGSLEPCAQALGHRLWGTESERTAEALIQPTWCPEPHWAEVVVTTQQFSVGAMGEKHYGREKP